MRPSTLALLGLAWSASAAAQTFVPAPKAHDTVSSKILQGAEISYKQTSICETTEGVKSYAGYLTLPKKVLEDAEGWDDDQSAHIFFWYFEARSDPKTAPTSIYLGGGPGTTSFDGMSDFPCYVNPDSNSTTLNEHSWNNNVNMLYIDQPLGTGFSYVSLLNGTMDYLTSTFTPVESEDDLPELNATTVQATLDVTGTLDPTYLTVLPLTTMSAARTMWKFVQVWFHEFPERNTENDELSLWTASYGGFYGPAFFSYFADQNKLIQDGKHPVPNARALKLGTLGLLDACIDVKAMARGYPEFAYNNTFGIEVYPEEVYNEVMELIEAPEEGCVALIDGCRSLAEEGDPQSFGLNETVNAACLAATDVCFNKVQGALQVYSDRSPFDITMVNISQYPPDYRTAFFNQRWVQEELGVPLNFTASSQAIVASFFTITGDPMVRTLSSLEHVLDSGVNVAMVYGDRYGGEDVSLALDFPTAESFHSAGYEPIATNASYDGGLVREAGSLSFSRIFQAGHGVAGYQPETMYHVFGRAMSRRDVATGKVDLSETTDYASDGPRSVRNVTNELPEPELSVCHVDKAPISCTSEQLAALADGSALVEYGIVVEPEGTSGQELDGGEGSSNGDGDADAGEKAAGDDDAKEDRPGAAASTYVKGPESRLLDGNITSTATEA
ncbi:Carboxypeptidase S1 A-like protein [Hapsidospora chrysogenum ATCC 11550]|uniref:Carboxypeptidase S1 A-like protein n=1 Tax=Hapsidospora chrysogenum (strain ATCC 11550 / CBS 779.69 / DSM 880 / IAM 14645 / JCM 23072 / IMI 49137) TaxID=857340 RepID=A0A086SZ09_HAPC1|nr:Carboxypeptidase S1 A-like protein [Hapsidospora chrysogenum ATCC 11550]